MRKARHRQARWLSEGLALGKLWMLTLKHPDEASEKMELMPSCSAQHRT